jgi:hypothetical protein
MNVFIVLEAERLGHGAYVVRVIKVFKKQRVANSFVSYKIGKDRRFGKKNFHYCVNKSKVEKRYRPDIDQITRDVAIRIIDDTDNVLEEKEK